MIGEGMFPPLSWPFTFPREAFENLTSPSSQIRKSIFSPTTARSGVLFLQKIEAVCTYLHLL